jgi:O-methyltransferase
MPDVSLLRRAWRKVYWSLLHGVIERIDKRRLTRGDRTPLRLLPIVAPYTMAGYARLINAYQVVRRAEEARIVGAIVECGVFKGGAAGMMTMAASPQRAVWLFDSFEGLPEPTAEDGEKAVVYAGDRSGGALQPIDRCVGPLESVEDLFFEKLKIDRRRVMIRKGWFQDTLPIARNEIGPVAVLRLDGDWYDSTKVCLDNLYDLVSPGGYVIIDDYGYWEGCRRAVDEFLAARRLRVDLVPIDDSGVWFQVPC